MSVHLYIKPDPLSAFLHRRAHRHGPVMLTYHAIQAGGGSPTWPWAVSMRRFREQLDLLAAYDYATPTLRELITPAEEGWPTRTAAISFDDGYVDNLDAWEELRKRGMRATWFIVAGSIGRTPNWPADGRPGGRLLNAGELRAMHESGMEIGSHGTGHRRLTELSENELARELQDSREMLEDLLGASVTSFAYPYGESDERCDRAVRAAGYLAACTTRTGWATRDKNPYRIRRLTLFNDDTVATLTRKLAYAANDVSWPSLLRQHLAAQIAPPQ